jgi:hypothetical protein
VNNKEVLLPFIFLFNKNSSNCRLNLQQEIILLLLLDPLLHTTMRVWCLPGAMVQLKKKKEDFPHYHRLRRTILVLVVPLTTMAVGARRGVYQFPHKKQEGAWKSSKDYHHASSSDPPRYPTKLHSNPRSTNLDSF